MSGEPNVFVINLINNTENGGSARVVSADDDPYGPEPVALTMAGGAWAATKADGLVKFTWTGGTPSGTAINIYRNGVLVERNATTTPTTITRNTTVGPVAIPVTSWTDTASRDTDTTTNNQALCYSLERQYTSGLKNVSQRTNPACYWGAAGTGGNPPERLNFINTDSATNVEGTDSRVDRKTDHDRVHLANWGVLGDVLTFTFTPATGGTYDILLRYGNAFGPVNTGVSAAVKQMEVSATNQTTRRGVVVMPHLPSWDTWGESSVLQVTLAANTAYTVSIRDYYNMSYLASNATYVIGDPPEVGVVNRANIAELILRRRSN